MRRNISLVAVLAFITACSSGGAASEEIDITGNWQLVSGSADGQAIPLIDDSPVTLNITRTEVGGTSACNLYGGPFILDGSTISIGDLFSTMMACNPEDMAVESLYTAALPEVETVALEGGELVMSGPGIELRFAAAG